MSGNERPLSVTILAWVYIGVGAVTFVYHFSELLSRNAFQNDAIWVEATELLAIIAGVFMLRGRNWARWLALAWIAFHVVLSVWHPFRELAIHALFCALIAWFLFVRQLRDTSKIALRLTDSRALPHQSWRAYPVWLPASRSSG